MKTRKVQKVGGSTFTVSLPREWADAEGLEQGDVVDLHTHADGTLVIEARDRETDPTGAVSVSIGDSGFDQVVQSLLTAYTAGYSSITLTTESELSGGQRQAANEVANILAGMTITDATDYELKAQVLIDSDKISIHQLVRQLSFIPTSMQQRAMASVSNPDSDLDLADRDDQADRLLALTERSFVQALSRLSVVDSLGITRSELFELWSTARDLERVADHAERINTIARRFDEQPALDHTSAVQELAARSRDVVDYGVRAVVEDTGSETVCEALKLRSRVREEVADLDQRLFDDDTADYRLTRILDSVRRTAEHGGNIAERGLQQQIRTGNELKLEHLSMASSKTTPVESPVEEDH